MTWEQIQLFAEKAGERLAQDRISAIDAQVGAIGIALTGDLEPLKRMAREAGVQYDTGARSESITPQFTGALRDLAGSGNLRIISRGADGRPAKHRTRSADRRVPRATPRR